MKSRWIIGSGSYLQSAALAWEALRPDEHIRTHEIPQAKDFSFDFGIFDQMDPKRDGVFIAFDERFGNFKRMELFQAAIERGYQLEPFISPRALLGPDVRIGPNAFIADGANLSAGVKVEYNCVVHAGAIVGQQSRIKSSCWVESGVLIGNHVEIGAHCTLRMGTQIASGVVVGRGCELAIPKSYRNAIAPKTVFDPRFDEPIFVFGK